RGRGLGARISMTPGYGGGERTSRWWSLPMRRGGRSATMVAAAVGSPARSFTPSRAKGSTDRGDRHETLARLVGNARLGEGGHSGMTGERGAQHRYGPRPAGCLAPGDSAMLP